ncbi:DUF5994 family protein [Amycolatopsis orientalis]|uniref:DUF5994 family protein n=1 Tax=Amycolatopsis orientalis TaxID=31958 RepID=UPI0003FBB5C0|nr:DUF5994 family protein [Amycolatopsis orientalis]
MPLNSPLESLVPTVVERLRLKPANSESGFVDGAWWPRSRDLVAEVPELATALAAWTGPVWRVAFSPAGWTVTVSELFYQGRLIRLEGISSQNVHLVHATGGTMRRVTLLVVPPHADPAAAERALAAASGQNNVTSPELLLDESGALGGQAVSTSRESDVSRWESEGGRGDAASARE